MSSWNTLNVVLQYNNCETYSSVPIEVVLALNLFPPRPLDRPPLLVIENYLILHKTKQLTYVLFLPYTTTIAYRVVKFKNISRIIGIIQKMQAISIALAVFLRGIS